MPLFSSIGAGNVQRTNKGKERGWYRARVITHGYVGGGYKDSSPWRNVNRTLHNTDATTNLCLLYTSPSPRDKRQSRMPSSA